MIEIANMSIKKMKKMEEKEEKTEKIFDETLKTFKKMSFILKNLISIELSKNKKMLSTSKEQKLQIEFMQIEKIKKMFIHFYDLAQKEDGVLMKIYYAACYYIFDSFENKLFFSPEIQKIKIFFRFENATINRW
jgi:hypothetical protein